MANAVPLPPETVLLVVLLCRLGILSIFFFFFRKTDWRLNLILSLVFVGSTIAACSGFVLVTESAPGTQALAYLGVGASVLAGPAILLYLRVYLTGMVFSIKRDLFHVILLPVALVIFISLAVMQNDRYTYQNLDAITAAGLLLCGGLYFVFSLRLIMYVDRKTGDRRRPIFWPLFIFGDYLALVIIRTVILFSRGAFDPMRENAYADILLLSAALSVLEVLAILVLGGLRLYRLRSPSASRRLSTEEVRRIVKLVRERVELKKVYRDPRLSLKSMARVLNVPHRDLARIMEERFSVNFMDYVNGFRVREAVALLEKFAGQRTILGLSLQSGFDSKAVFSKAFKKLTGFSPREYVKNFKKLR